MARRRKSTQRKLLELGVVLPVVAAIALTMILVKAPTVREATWTNPNETSSATLVDNPKTYDKKPITFTGEAILERMVRTSKEGEKGAWIHLNDDPYMYRSISNGAPLTGYNSGMAIWLDDASLTDVITLYGDYRTNGDVVTVTGIYNAACALHGGDMDIHGRALEISRGGYVVKKKVDRWKYVLTAIFGLLTLVLYLLNRRRFRRELAGLFKPSKERD